MYRTNKANAKPSLRYCEGYTCIICNDFTWAVTRSRYSHDMCVKCFDAIIDKLDDIFTYFIVNKKPTWKERRKFNKLEKLAWEALQEEVKRKAEVQKSIKKRVASLEIDVKYSEERRIENKEW